MKFNVREATSADADEMSCILEKILISWKSNRPFSKEHVLEHYIAHPDILRCTVAIDPGGTVIGFQSLKRATEGNPYDLPEGWGIIGTYVDANATGLGVGKTLFASSLDAAGDAGLTEIDATIADNNASGLAYYEAIGFRSYETKPGAICKKFVLD